MAKATKNGLTIYKPLNKSTPLKVETAQGTVGKGGIKV